MGRMTRRSFALAVSAGAFAAAEQAVGAAPVTGPGAASFDPLPYVHPELRKAAQGFLKYRGPPLTAETLPAMRKGVPRQPPSNPSWSERTIPGPPGAPAVKVYVVNAGANAPPRAAILYMHGGGFVAGAASVDLPLLLQTAEALDCVIVSVEYRLAPETRFPGALEDNYAALKWLHANAAELGVDRTRIAVMGESAGGGHAAMLAIAARDRGEIPLVYQALVYPMLDDRTGSTRRLPPQQGALMWTHQQNRFGWSALLGVPAGSRHLPYGAVPARVENLRDLPPAFIGVGSIDLFADEDIEYARRLIDAGVAVQLDVVPGAYHGSHVMVPNASISRQFKADLLAALRGALAPKAG